MARCILCDEWAGPDSDRHDECVYEFEAFLRQPDLFTRLLRRFRSALRMVYGVLVRSQVRAR